MIKKELRNMEIIRSKKSSGLILGAIMLALMTIITVSSCKEGSDYTEFSISKRVFSFENVKAGEVCLDSFFIKNDGEKTSIIKKAYGDCSCLKVKMTKNVVRPGETAKVNFSLNTKNKYGHEKNFILIEANTDSMLHYVTIISDVSD